MKSHLEVQGAQGVTLTHTPILSAQPFGMLARARTSDFLSSLKESRR